MPHADERAVGSRNSRRHIISLPEGVLREHYAGDLAGEDMDAEEVVGFEAMVLDEVVGVGPGMSGMGRRT